MDTKSEIIAGFKAVRLLGKGGMSEVYEVENVRLGSRHALKLYSYPKDVPDVRERFEVEGRLLAKLSHPRIVKVVDFGVDGPDGRPYFVMDLVCGPDGSVRSLADIGPGEADESEIGRWYDDIRDGLAYIHGKGVVHRDLKLQNILIGPDGHAVITDFGISKISDREDGSGTIVDPVQTIVRMQDGRNPVMGSLGYMAPELEMGVAATERSDWYALGVIAFRLLTGTWCDSRTNITDMLSSYDPVWMEILPWLLHSNPQGRKCLSYAEERGRLEELNLAAAEKKTDAEARRTRRFRILAAAMAIAAAVAGGAALFQTARLSETRAKLSIPDFDCVFQIPDSAGEEETEMMPSKDQFKAALLDAQVLTHRMFSDLKRGAITREKAAAMLADLAARAKEGDFNLFSDLAEGFTPEGEDVVLAILLENAAKRLK